MAKVDGSLHSLFQGVSQQPFKVMLPTQCRLQENMSSNPVDGLTRRPPTNFKQSLVTTALEPQEYNFTVKGIDYLLMAANNFLKVFRLDGTEVPVSLGSGASNCLTIGKFCFTTLKDIVYIANTSVKVQMTDDTKEYANQSSIIHLNGGQYGRDYIATVKWGVNTQTFHYLTPNGSVSTDTPKVASTYIATQLESAFNAISALTDVFTITRKDDVLLIESQSGTQDFNITMDDGAGSSVAFATNNSVIDVGNLPRYAPEGYYVAVTGSGSAAVDDYYLEFHADDNATSIGAGFGKPGIWKETVKQDIPYLIDANTMPFLLTYDETTDSFSLDAGEWKGRQVGDDVLTNENPSFIEATINFMSSFQGRLMFLSGINMIMSRTKKPLDFWRETATKTVDSDPIDIFSTAANVGDLMSCVPFDRDMVIFAKGGQEGGGGQFIVFGRNALTPDNCSLVLTTKYEADLNAIPVAGGKNIFFATKYGSFTGVREFFTETAADTNDSRNITKHVLKYIQGNVTTISSSNNFDILLVSSDANNKDIYAYEYIWQDKNKVQSSWSKWSFNKAIVHHFINNGVAFLVTRVNNDYMLESMDLNIQFDNALNYQVKLDSKVITQDVDTTIDNPMPHMPSDFNDMLFVQGTGCPNPGMLANVASHTSSTITFEDSMEGGTIISGIKYGSRYKPNMPFVKDKDGVTIGTGKLIINKFIVNYRDTGFIGSIVTSPYMDDRTTEFTGRLVADPNTLIGEPAIINGSYIIPFRQDTAYGELELFADNHLPMTIIDIEWKGQYTKLGTRVPTGS